MRVFYFIRKNIISILFILFTLFLVLFSQSNLTSARNGLLLWANNVIPSLFPFLVAVELLKETNAVFFISKIFNKYMKPIFNLPGVSAFPFIMGLLSGYPVGAKIVCDLYRNKLCSKQEAERMLPFVNNSGPLFIIGTVGISFYGSTEIGFILLLSHILSSITLGIFLGIFSRVKYTKTLKSEHISHSFSLSSSSVSISELGTILSSSIMSSVKTILLIGGFVTLFSVIVSILEKTQILLIFSKIIGTIFKLDTNFINAFITGIIEFTNGLSQISSIHMKNISVNLVISAFILAFGGISVTLQVLSIISRNDLSIKKYIYGKLIQALISVVYTFLILQFPICNFNI